MKLIGAFSTIVAALSGTSLVEANGKVLRGSVDNGAIYLKSDSVVNMVVTTTDVDPVASAHEDAEEAVKEAENAIEAIKIVSDEAGKKAEEAAEEGLQEAAEAVAAAGESAGAALDADKAAEEAAEEAAEKAVVDAEKVIQETVEAAAEVIHKAFKAEEAEATAADEAADEEIPAEDCIVDATSCWDTSDFANYECKSCCNGSGEFGGGLGGGISLGKYCGCIPDQVACGQDHWGTWLDTHDNCSACCGGSTTVDDGAWFDQHYCAE